MSIWHKCPHPGAILTHTQAFYKNKVIAIQDKLYTKFSIFGVRYIFIIKPLIRHFFPTETCWYYLISSQKHALRIGSQLQPLAKVLLMTNQNLYFHGEIRKYLSGYPSYLPNTVWEQKKPWSDCTAAQFYQCLQYSSMENAGCAKMQKGTSMLFKKL